MVKTYGEAYRTVKALLTGEEGERAGSTARELLSFASGHSAAALMGMFCEPIETEVYERCLSAAERVLRAEPLAYILGKWSFYGLELTVTPDVLIPRDDTMAVVDLALERAHILPEEPKLLDLCTGSGCIGLALADRLPQAQVLLCDISEKALEVARCNALQLGLGGSVSCLCLDVLQTSPFAAEAFDLIISNPPYITGEEMKQLQRSVAEYEPHCALYGGEDGLVFYRAIAKNYYGALRNGGYLCFEFGQGQETDVCRILMQSGYDVLELRKDYGNIVRAVIAQKKERNHENGNG